jgi:cytochrome c oxidase subunit 4
MSVHISPVRSYVGIFLALLVLTAVTVGMAFIDLGALNDVVAMTIAVGKALLVILFFMHVRYSTRLVWLTVAAGFVWLGIFFLLILPDYMTRAAFIPVPGK